MYLTKYKPIETLLDNFFSSEGRERAFEPRANIYEDNDKYTIDLELAGVDKKNVKVEVKDNVLVIEGKKEETEERKTKHSHRIESWHGSFQRQFDLGDSIKSEGIKASHKDGILKIELPKKEEQIQRQTVKKIEVQ